MTTLNAAVVRGHTPTLDADGKYQMTPTRLGLIALATVTIDLTDGVAEEDIKFAVVSMAKLAAAVKNLLPKLALTGTDDADGTGTMAIQLQNGAAASLAGRARVRTWISTSDMGAPAAVTDFSVTTGTPLAEVAADADYEVITNATGGIVMNIDKGGAGTVYVMAELDGLIYSATLVITA